LVVGGGALVGVAFGVGAPYAQAQTHARTHARIMLHSLVSGEEVDLDYRRDGVLLAPALARIAAVLRDPVTGARGPIDISLVDFLHVIAGALEVPPEFDVLGAFDSSAGLHGAGRAIDARLRGVACADFAECAAGLARGGVGHYRAARFVHVDTGPPRQWRG
jgi:uncharacterized protein YcbK (DUF882 family)